MNRLYEEKKNATVYNRAHRVLYPSPRVPQKNVVHCMLWLLFCLLKLLKCIAVYDSLTKSKKSVSTMRTLSVL